MPRAKRPTRPGSRKYKGYNDESMQRAVAECREGASFKRVAERYGINRTTLMNHVKGLKCKKVGRPTVLTQEEEEMLVQSLVKLGEWGYGLNRLQIQRCVQDYLRRLDRPNPFKDGLPGLDWCLMFENRWKAIISRRVAQNLPRNRAVAGTKEVMEDMFEKLKNVIERLGLQNKPQNIYNCDEIGFQTDAGIQKVMCRRGSRNPNKLVGSVTKATYTVLMCCNAIGDFSPMFINYKGIHLYSTWCVNGPDRALYNCSPSGWMEAAQFLDWFEKCFVKETSKIEGNKLLILDGHNSHISLELIEMAMQNNIEIFCLPAHTSHLLQPLDVGVYKSVKNAWRLILREYYQESGYKNVDKLVFPSLMKKLSKSECLSRANAVGGFEGSGIFPLCKDKMMRKVEIAEIVSEQGQTVAPSIPLVSNNVSELHATNLPSTSEENLPDEKTNNGADNGSTPTTPSLLNSSSSSAHNMTQSLMSVLKVQNQKESLAGKRSRITRKFAESLTSLEVVERLRCNKAKKQVQKTVKKGKRKVADLPSSSSDSEVSVILESEEEMEDVHEDDASTKIDQTMEAVQVNPKYVDIKAVEKGSWIISKYGNSYYVGQILEIKGNKAETIFLRKKELYFVHPDIIDIDHIEINQVMQILEPPLIQRGRHYFNLAKFLPKIAVQ